MAEQTDHVQIQQLPGSREGVRILKVIGPLTIRNFFEFQDLSRNNSARALIVDLGDVPYMDSAALGCLLGIHVSCERSGRKYALIQAGERLEKMFSVSGVQDLLVRYPTLSEAEAALSNS